MNASLEIFVGYNFQHIARDRKIILHPYKKCSPWDVNYLVRMSHILIIAQNTRLIKSIV